MREVSASISPLAFYTDREHTELKLPKAAAKLAFYTESVFDFHLNIEIIPVSINYTAQKQLHIFFQREFQFLSMKKSINSTLPVPLD
ncbi:hypothetical protein [Catalinimonas niigatensis]|uniref:hypothetical protein n=1 Tax=Catalinimonas niigatensis TaxID=1397264 RepID=UPI00266625EC|nr:hypothetical protein [Catalinimonas niigatensis]WPP51224.1 hypothetical protein PZB72_02320 [Catalinimonas niigatensis]